MSIELVVIAGLAILGSCVIALLAGRFSQELTRSYTKEVGRILAQADESRKASFAQMQVAMGRITAVAFPSNHQIHRTTSGVVEGAQQTITPHFANDPDLPPDEPVLDPTSGLDRIIERNGSGPVNRIVTTPSEYGDHDTEEPS